MAFGKRRTPPSRPGAGGPAPSPAAVVPTVDPAARYRAFTERMLAVLGQTSIIAQAIRDDGTFAVRGMDSEVHPDTTPIDVKGFDEHFTLLEAGSVMHPVYGYVQPSAPTQVDQSAQLHLHGLVARVMELNLYCQRAVRDDALIVALQSPKLPPLVDRILVSSAFFAAYFENIAATQALLLSGETAASLSIDHAKLQDNMQRRRLIALDCMLAPHSADELTPYRKLPWIGVETTIKPHAGQRFVQGVYFPAGLTPAPIGPGIRAMALAPV